MIVDSSALLALLFREASRDRILDALAAAERPAIGAPTLAETGIVLAARLGEEAAPALALLLERLAPQIIPFEAVHAAAARRAFERFGRGRHPAALNFGDCLTCAVAKVARQPLLYVGQDFTKTDLEPAI